MRTRVLLAFVAAGALGLAACGSDTGPAVIRSVALSLPWPAGPRRSGPIDSARTGRWRT